MPETIVSIKLPNGVLITVANSGESQVEVTSNYYTKEEIDRLLSEKVEAVTTETPEETNED